jgi:hypothetical protein
MRLNWFRKEISPKKTPSWELSTPLVALSAVDAWTIADAFMGLIILGATGAGKSTGAGAACALAFLRAGFGGIVLCCKAAERRVWQAYAKATGRSDDLIIFDASGTHRFSFLDEELKRSGEGAGLTENIVALLSVILEIAERNGGDGGRADEGYWKRANRQLCRNFVDLLVMAKGRVTVPDLYRAVVSAPTTCEEAASEKWKKESFCFQCLREADAATKSPRAIRDLALVADYLLLEFPALSDRTRSVVVSTFTSMIDVLNRSLLRELFSESTTVRPEDALDGKIIIVDLPVKEFAEIGQFAAVLWKYCFQKAVERRDVAANPRPVFLFADEFQHFTVEYDMQFQATARSSRAATVYLTQNISNLLAAFGGHQAKAVTDSLLGNLQSKWWCANGDPETNEHAASVIGRSRKLFMNSSHPQGATDWLSLAGFGKAVDGSVGFSEQLEFQCGPERFTTLRPGGPEHDWQVDVIAFQGGRRFKATGKTWLPSTFRQQF